MGSETAGFLILCEDIIDPVIEHLSVCAECEVGVLVFFNDTDTTLYDSLAVTPALTGIHMDVGVQDILEDLRMDAPPFAFMSASDWE